MSKVKIEKKFDNHQPIMTTTMIYTNLYLLGLLPLLIFILLRFQRWRKNKKNLFANTKFQSQIFEKEHFLSPIFPYIYLLGFLFLILAMLNFSTQNKEKISVNHKNSNILFLVDVSNSMNAQDTEPSRLERAKNILKQSLSALHNERVGIVVFAGEARSIMPLTTDYSSANIFLNNISSKLVPRQGTDFLLAVKEGVKKLNHAPAGTKKIILISDGENNEGNHNAAIRESQNNDIIITTVGIGTEKGSPIPEYLFNYYQDYKRDEYGQVILTKRETSALKSIAKDTYGEYIDGNAEDAAEKIIKNINSTQKENYNNTINTLNTTHHYQWFLGIAIFSFSIFYLASNNKP